MEFIQIILNSISLIFAALGIFITAESIKIRTFEKNQIKTKILQDESFDDYKSKYSQKMNESKMGLEIIEAEYLLKTKTINMKNSAIIKNYRNQGYIPFSNFFHKFNIWVDDKNLFAIFFLPFLLLVGIFNITILIFPLYTTQFAILLFIFIILSFSLPFGLYGDLEKKNSKIIYTFFSLGEVKKLHCVIEELNPSGYKFTFIFEFTFIFFNIKMPKELITPSIESGVEEFIKIRKFCKTIENQYNYTYIEAKDFINQTGTMGNDMHYGYMRTIHIIASKLNFKDNNTLERNKKP
jgi:hypothetical protein